ncbi:hypothetical protein HYT17_00965 [Candidatus Microgenomates bacterium]|nr:hypothetical protein [Candidatus Microgenomates bacterium]
MTALAEVKDRRQGLIFKTPDHREAGLGVLDPGKHLIFISHPTLFTVTPGGQIAVFWGKESEEGVTTFSPGQRFLLLPGEDPPHRHLLFAFGQATYHCQIITGGETLKNIPMITPPSDNQLVKRAKLVEIVEQAALQAALG